MKKLCIIVSLIIFVSCATGNESDKGEIIIINNSKKTINAVYLKMAESENFTLSSSDPDWGTNVITNVIVPDDSTRLEVESGLWGVKISYTRNSFYYGTMVTSCEVKAHKATEISFR